MCSVPIGALIVVAAIGLVMFFLGHLMCKIRYEHEKYMEECKKRSDKSRRDNA